MATKIYPWNEFRQWGVDVQALIGEPLAANKRYRVAPCDLPPEFQDRLRKDGFDVAQQVTFEAVIGRKGFSIEVHQDSDRGATRRRA